MFEMHRNIWRLGLRSKLPTPNFTEKAYIAGPAPKLRPRFQPFGLGASSFRASRLKALILPLNRALGTFLRHWRDREIAGAVNTLAFYSAPEWQFKTRVVSGQLLCVAEQNVAHLFPFCISYYYRYRLYSTAAMRLCSNCRYFCT